MKFGRNLARNQVPEWASSYINYKGLKKLIKNATEVPKQTGEPDLAGFFHSLDRNLEDVDHFYNKKLQEFSRRLKLLEDRYGATQDVAKDLAVEDREELLAALLELRGQYRKLQWYGEVNRRGFIKITKKLDKKTTNLNAQKKYLALKVDPAPFATNTELFTTMTKLNDWISLLGDAVSAARADEALSVPALSLKHPNSSNHILNLPAETYNVVEQYIRQDQASQLNDSLIAIRNSLPEIQETVFQQFLKGLLHRASSARSRLCTVALLQQIVFLDDLDDINRRNCIHRLVLSIGRAHSVTEIKSSSEIRPDAEAELYNFITPAAQPLNPFKINVAQEGMQRIILTHEDEKIAYLQFFLDNLQPTQQSALISKDATGRTPLHFAAEYGVRVMCEVIIEHLQRWKLFNVEHGIDGPEWQDNEGWAPLHLSVIGGHPLTTQTLLDSENWNRPGPNVVQTRRNSPKSSAVLGIATKANFIEVVKILVRAGVDINYQDEQGETALHIAARFGHADCARLLIIGNGVQKANTELAENTYSWTPLFVACVDGHLPIVELLIDAGADLERTDASGWTAKEHAALRGNITIADRLADVTSAPDADSVSSSPIGITASSPTTPSLIERKSYGITSSNVKMSEPVKAFGHRYLTDKSLVLVSLGTMNMRDPRPPVRLDRIPLTSAHNTQLDTALSVVISAKGAEGEPEVVDLPVQENISTDAMVFHCVDPSNVKLLFDLVPTYAGTHDRIVGRAAALLSSLRPSLGSKKMQLQGDVTVPILAATDLEVIGSLTFNYLVITPFNHPKMSLKEDQTYWKSLTSTMVIGHRGLGKNMPGRNSLQLGENTIQSFIAAANLGASYVEFDIQLTKDLVPVIYHDFLVSETGIDAPVHTLTLEQFLHVNNSRTPRHSRDASPSRLASSKPIDIRNGDPRQNARHRSMSLGGPGHDSAEIEERMKHTRDFKKKGFKGNSRGTHIQAPFATLEEMFKKLPQSVGFNMEMKYPMLSESEDEEMDRYAVEINSFVDTVLEKVYELGNGRNMIFSSFNPDICLLLSFKQPNIPILFLTDAGTCEVGDIRATSLQEAIRFASRWNLLGVVSSAQPFVLAPRLVRVVKDSGLVCVSYGTQNNNNDKVRLQVKQGIDAVIVDSVLAIRRGLTGGYVGKKSDGALKELKSLNKADSNSSTESLQIPRVVEPEEEATNGVNGTNGVDLSSLTKSLQLVS